MALRLKEQWLWDFWLVQNENDYHVFYLQAPRSLGSQDLRHWNVSIGHAVSQDLINWRVLQDALAPSATPSWDDYTTWTGSIIHHRNLWYLFYTGTSKAEDGLVQRIGLATSSDLLHWEKCSRNPLIEADPRWYELLDQSLWHDQAWRDPWVFYHPEQNDFHMFITARVNYGPADGRGVIAHARSDNLLEWQVLPPVSLPGQFGQLEVPQLVEEGGRYILLFCLAREHYAKARRAQIAKSVTGTHYLVAENRLGPYKLTTDRFLVGDEIGSFYAGKMVCGPDGNWKFLATRQFATDGGYIGELSDPFPVNWTASGEPRVDW